MRHNQYLVFVLALVGACDPEKSGSASDGASSTGGGTTDGSITDGGATDGGATDASPTTGAVATTGAEATGGGTGDTSTGGPLDPDHVALCEAFCAKGPECGLRPGGQECVDFCVAEIAAEMGLCGEAERALLTCSIAMTCREFVALGEEMELGPCTDAFEAKAMYCGGSGCAYEASGDPEAGTCELAGSCPGVPVPVKMVCDAQLCRCFAGDDQIDQCAAEDACLDLEGLETKGFTCCGLQ